MFYKIKIIFTLTLCFFYQSSFSQIQIQTSFHRAFLFPHTPSVKGLVTKNFNLYEIGITVHGDSTNFWKKMYPHSYWGINYLYTDMANKTAIGNVHAILPYFAFNILHKNKVNIYFELATGAAFFTKKFNRITNYKNNAIGSNINMAMRGFFTLSYSITNNIIINTGLGVNHFSNAAFMQPNLGLNVLSTKLSIAYTLNKKNIKNKYHYNKIANFEKIKWLKQIHVAIAKKQIDIVNKKNYIIYSLNYGIGLHYKKYYITQLHIEYHYNSSLKKELNSMSSLTNNRMSIGIAQEFLINNLAIYFALGTYFLNANPNQKVYTKLGLKYYFKNNISCFVNLKTHLNKADYFETGIGYVFK